MSYVEQLRQFLGESVDEGELRAVAAHAIAADVRRLKAAIAGRVWEARQLARDMPDDAAQQLVAAKSLLARYQRALDEYALVTGRVSAALSDVVKAEEAA
jgi:hypothetical protein